jgi:hypothetical protein
MVLFNKRWHACTAQAHGVLMVVAVAVLLPISAAIARALRGTLGPRLWFEAHRALGVRANTLSPAWQDCK